MAGQAEVYNGDWGVTGEKLDVRYVAPIPHLSHYWLSHGMDPGTTSRWTDRVSEQVFTAPSVSSQHPTVYESALKVLRFDGTNDRLDTDMGDFLTKPHTLFIAARFNQPAANTYVMTGGQGPSYNLYINGAGAFGFYGAAGISSGVVGDGSNHIFMFNYDGANSTFTVDGTEVSGNPGTITANTIRLGATSGGYSATDIQAMGFIPRATTVAERVELRRRLRKQLGF